MILLNCVEWTGWNENIEKQIDTEGVLELYGK